MQARIMLVGLGGSGKVQCIGAFDHLRSSRDNRHVCALCQQSGFLSRQPCRRNASSRLLTAHSDHVVDVRQAPIKPLEFWFEHTRRGPNLSRLEHIYRLGRDVPVQGIVASLERCVIELPAFGRGVSGMFTPADNRNVCDRKSNCDAVQCNDVCCHGVDIKIVDFSYLC
jgi:hypothetical protein